MTVNKDLQSEITEFEATYAELRKPLRLKAIGKAPSLESVVRTGDVEQLEKILAGGKLEQYQSNSEEPGRVTYVMAHWLVDNSGREDLARRWMVATGHNTELAAKHFEKLVQGDVWQKLVMQRSLGMSTLVDAFSMTPDEENAPFHEMLGLDGDVRRRNGVNMLLASILRLNHPEAPPDVSPYGDAARQKKLREPLIYHSWMSMGTEKFLSAIEMAYKDTPEIRRQMQEGIDAYIGVGRLSLLSGSNDRTWKMFDRWGSPDVGEKIWGSKTSNDPFVVAVCKFWSDKVAQRLDGVLATGVDINSLSKDAQDKVNDIHYRILDAAVFTQNVDALVWLLDRGADPMLESKSSHPIFQMTTLKRAELMLQNQTGDADKADRVMTVLRATVAKTAAHQAMVEMEQELGPSEKIGARP